MDHKTDVSISKVVEWQQKLYSPRDMLRLTDPEFDPRPASGSGGGSGQELLDQENHHQIAAILKATYKDTHFAGGGAAASTAERGSKGCAAATECGCT